MIRLVADTLSCLTPMQASRLDIPLLPQIVIFGDESFRDDTEISSQQFLERLQNSQVLPKTAAPPPHLYHPIFEKAQSNGDTVIVVCPSADLSGTFRSATVAAQDFPETDIRIIDTRLIAAGLGAVIKEAHRQLQNGASPETIIQGIEEMSKHEQLYLVVDTLEYLHKGGRIGGAQALFGSLLQIKPILTMKDGIIQPVESQRTRKHAFARITELVMENKPAQNGSYLCVQHGGADNAALAIADWFSKELDLEKVTIYNLPPAVLVHAGPRAVAVSFFTHTTEDWT